MKNNTDLTDGKFPPALLEDLLQWRGAESADVLAGPGIGEDAALIRWPEGAFLTVSSDPIVGAQKGAGHLLVAVNANDIACKGFIDRFFLLRHKSGGGSQPHPFVGTDMFVVGVSLEASGTDFQESNAAPVIGIHIGMYLKYKS